MLCGISPECAFENCDDLALVKLRNQIGNRVSPDTQLVDIVLIA